MKYLVLFSLVFFSVSCGKEGNAPSPVPLPAKTVLVFPANNEVCLQGSVISNAESNVVFKWRKAANVDLYEVKWKNLKTEAVSSRTSADTTIQVTLARGIPFSWYVISKSNRTTQTAESDTWKFYNSGPGLTFYAPFPAELVAPSFGQQVTPVAGKINLDWTGSDPDNDIKEYDIYLGTTTTPALIKGNNAASDLAGVTVAAGSTYYWRVISRDIKGNTSQSPLYNFRVN